MQSVRTDVCDYMIDRKFAQTKYNTCVLASYAIAVNYFLYWKIKINDVFEQYCKHYNLASLDGVEAVCAYDMYVTRRDCLEGTSGFGVLKKLHRQGSLGGGGVFDIAASELDLKMFSEPSWLFVLDYLRKGDVLATYGYQTKSGVHCSLLYLKDGRIYERDPNSTELKLKEDFPPIKDFLVFSKKVKRQKKVYQSSKFHGKNGARRYFANEIRRANLRVVRRVGTTTYVEQKPGTKSNLACTRYGRYVLWNLTLKPLEEITHE